MDPEQIKNKDHREYLKLKDNPTKVSNSAIFSLVSDTLTDIKVSIGVLEAKQDQTSDQITELDKRVEKVTDGLDDDQKKLRADFEAHSVIVSANKARVNERLVWTAKTQKVIITLSISILSLILYLNFGISFP